MDALVVTRANGHRLFLWRYREDFARLAPRGTDGNVDGPSDRFSNHRPIFSRRMGREYDELRRSSPGLVYCAVAPLASDKGRGVLRSHRLSSYERAIVFHRRISLAGDCWYHFVFVTELAAARSFHFPSWNHTRFSRRCEAPFSAKATRSLESGNDVPRISDSLSTMSLSIPRRKRMDLHATPFQLANDASLPVHAWLFLCNRSKYWHDLPNQSAAISHSQPGGTNILATRHGRSVCTLPGDSDVTGGTETA